MNISAKKLWRKSLMVLVNLALLAGLVWSARPAAPVSAASSGYVQEIEAGGLHTCMVTAAGGVKCWGYNDFGQVGDGTSGTSRYVPLDVSGLTSGVSAVVTGRFHSCALTTAGAVKCWGANAEGQLGDGTNNASATPVDVDLGSGVTAIAIAAGENHTCVVLDGGGVKCWGDNTAGQLGDNVAPPSDSNTPVTVSGLTNASAVTAGQYHTCALTTDGSVKCWGYNVEGQLGDNQASSTWRSLVPVQVSGLTSGVSRISAGLNHTCALVSGGVKCWGKNNTGQLGDNSTTDRLVPVDAQGLTSGVSSVEAGYQHTCAVTTGGAAMCWGDNTQGQIGNTTFMLNPIPIPVNVSGLGSGVNAVSGGGEHSCALLSSGLVKCWGGNVYGQLGDGNAPAGSDVPVYQLWLNTYAASSVSQGMCSGNGPCFTGIQQAINMATGYPYYATVTIDVQAGTYTGAVDLNKYATLSFADGVTLNGGLTQSENSTINAPAGTLSITGNWTRNAGVFNHNDGTVVFSGSGEQTISGNATWFNNLTVNSGSTVVVPAPVANRPTVDGVITNNGTLRQTQTVSAFTDFLALSNKEYTIQKYWGVQITPDSSMGATTVTIGGNQLCTNRPADEIVKRCFEITPSTPATASITFHYTEAERNGQTNSAMVVYHWNTSTHEWEQEQGSYWRSGTGDAQLVNVTGVSNYSKFVLGSGEKPTAVKLSALTGVSGGWGFSVLLGFVAAFALTRRKRR